MLKYVILRPVFWLVLLIGGTGCYFGGWNWWTLVIPSLIYSGLVAYGSYQIQWNFHLKSINRLPNTPHAVSITFDDGPIPGYTEKILDILDHHQVKATFFLIGNRVEAHPALAQKIVEQGHLIGNHSHNHTFWFDLHSFKQMRDELATCNDTVEKITGKKMRLFRPPYGVTTPIMTRVLKSNGMTSIGWTLRSMDTVIKDPTVLLEKLKKTKPGDIVLLHDIGHHTSAVLDEYLSHLKKKQIPVKRLDELIGINYA